MANQFIKKGKTVYLADFDANGKPYLRKLSEMEAKTLQATNKMKSGWDKYGKSLSSMFSALAIGNFITKSVQAFAEQEKSIKKLDAALGHHSKTLINHAAALQKVSVYGDEEIIKQQAFLAALKFSEAQIKRIIPVALDLAAATGQTLEFAVRNTAKTYSGLTGELGELVPQLKTLTKEQMQAGDAVKVMGELFGGMASAEAQTFEGKIKNINNRFGNLTEQVGERLVPAIEVFIERLEDVLGVWERIEGKFSSDDAFWNIIGKLVVTGGDWGKTVEMLANENYQRAKADAVGSTENPMFTYIPPKSKGRGGAGGGKTIPMIGTRKMDRPLSYLDAVVGNMGNRGGDSSGYNPLSGFSAQMTETVLPEFEMKFEEVGDSFVNKFSQINNIGNQFGNILNISADSFVGKLIDGVNTMSQVLSLITSIVSLASGGGVTSLFGLAKGGVVVNRGGQMSLGNLPKFAAGGSYMVPSGYMNDSGLIRVQSGERVDVTPNTRVPLVESMLKQTKSAIMAMNRNMVAGSAGSQQRSIILNLDGRRIAELITGRQNNMRRGGVNMEDFG